MNKRGLGKGLGALFGATPISAEDSYLGEPSLNADAEKIGIDKIIPNRFQPRRVFDQKALTELAGSIRENGVIQPIIVRKIETGYELVAGERRWRAAKIAELETIPAITREYSDTQMLQIALIENIQRQELNAIEEAQAYRRLIEEFGLTQGEIAQNVGRSRSVIANHIRLLNLPAEIQSFILDGRMTMGQAKPLLAIEDVKLQMDAAIKIVAENYSARDVEELVKTINASYPGGEDEPSSQKISDNNELAAALFSNKEYMDEYEDRLRLILGTKVRIKPGKIKSKIEIEFYSNEDLERIVEALSPGEDKTNNYIVRHKGQLVV